MNVRTFLRNGARIALLAVVATCTDQRSTTAPHAISTLTPQIVPVIAPALLTAGNNLTNTKTYTTASISPSPNKLVLVAVMGIRTFGASPSPTIAGGGMATWIEVASVAFDSIPFAQRRMTVYRGVSATPGSGPITFTFTHNQSNAQWIVLQVDGAATSGFHGSDAIGQIGSNVGDLVDGLSVSLQPFTNSGNVALGVFGIRSGTHGLPMITPGAGFTEINEQVSQESTPSDFQVEWATDLNTVSATWADLFGGALAIEINVAQPLPEPVATVSVDPTPATVNVGATVQLTATPRDANGNPLTGRAVTWGSTDAAVATVSETGLVTGVSAGLVTITATSEQQSGTAAVTVTVPVVPVAAVTVEPATASLDVGATLQLTATPRDANGDPLAGREVTWSSSDPAIATVSATGLVSGVAGGSVTITAESEDRTGTANLTVRAVPTFSHTLLTFGTDPANLRTYTTASIAPAANALVTVAVLEYSTMGTPPVPTLTGGGMQAWDVVATVVFDPGLTFPLQRLTIFRAMSAAPGSGPITITSPIIALSHLHWSVSQWTGVAGSGVNGSGAVRQIGSAPGDHVSGLTVSLDELASPTNVAYGAFGVQIRTTDVIPGAGFTEISEQASGENTPGDLQTQWGINLTSVPATWATLPAPNAGGLAIEINTLSAPGTPPAPVAMVTVEPATASLNVGATLQLTATPKDGSGNPLAGRVVTWTSSDLSRATVSSTGLVTGVGVGPVTITATSEQQSGTSAVTVTLVPVATVTVTPNPASVNVGATLQLTATPKDANGNPLGGRVVTWASSDLSRATVSSTGLVTGVGAGPVAITATSEQQSGTSAVTVTLAPVASVTVTPNPASVNVGATLQLTATPKDVNGNALTGRVVTWTSSDLSRATVSSTGLVTGVGVGPVTITATSEQQSGTSAVTVALAPVATVEVEPSSPSVNVGATVQLTATLRDANGIVLTGRLVTWASGDQARATVSSSGLVTGMGAGPVTITATSEQQSGTSAVTVTLVPVASVTVAPNPGSVNVGATLQLTATPKDANGDPLAGRVVTWVSSDPARATVSSTGLVTGVATGPVTITATSEQQSGISAVTVTPAPVATVTVTPNPGSVTVGATLQLTATLQDANGNTLTGRVVTWASGDLARATVSSAGLVTGVGAGPVTITATSEQQSGTSAVTVTLVPVASVTVTPDPASVNVGATVQLTATPRDAGGNALIGRAVTWSSGDVARATVNTTGLVTGVSAGPVTITATSEGQSGTSAVTVSLVPVATVDVTPAASTLGIGGTVQLTATPKDAAGNPLAGRAVTWGSSNPGFATVSASGLVSAVAVGSATISATSEGQVGTAGVTVTGAVVLVGAGDIAECGAGNLMDEATALLLDAYPGPVFTAGDNAYENGSATDYANCYEPSWGRHKARTRPAVGNHEYNTSGATPYYAYFGASAGPAGLGYYSYDLGDWHVVVLNSNISRGATSAQVTWLKADLAASTKQCTVAIFHHPQWTNNPTRSDNQYNTRPFWDAMWTAGVDLVINGHDHHYVRWAPQTPKGGPDVTGIRQITVGTGGRTDLYELSSQPRATVEARNNVTFGVLELTLRNGAYDWRFVPIAGQTFTDNGTSTCFAGQRPPPPNQLPVARPGGPYQSQGVVAFDGRASSDPDGDNPLTYHWEFGDGLSGTGAQTTHTYVPGTYTATLRVTDNLGGQSAPATTTVTITNLAPTVNAGPDIALGLGQPFHLQAGIGDAVTDGPWTYEINWGDGATETGSAATQGAAAISATHVYAAAGSFNAIVTVTDKHGATGSDAITAIVTDLPPGTIVHTLLTAANNAGNLQVYSTAAIAPGPNALITVAVLGYSTLATPPIPTLSGGGMATWSMVSTVTFDGPTPSRRLTVFRAMSAQPGNGPLTIASSGTTLSNMQWIVSQWDGVDVSGVNGAGAVLQAGSTSGAVVNGLTVNLNAFSHPNNVAFGVFGVKKNTTAVTPGLGFTEISEVPSGESSDGDLQAQRGTNLPAVGATWTSLTGGAIGIEIKVRP